MKRLVILMVALAMLISLCGFIIPNVGNGNYKTREQREVEAFTETYFRKCMDYMYLSVKSDFSSDTILSALDEKSPEFADKVSSLSAFLKDSGKGIAEWNGVTAGTMGTDAAALRKNLKFWEDRLAYARYMNDAYEITYNYFIQTYTFLETTVDGDYAVTDIWERSDFQYSGVDFTSGDGQICRISLMKINGAWKIAEVMSNDYLFRADSYEDFDLETAIRDYEDMIAERETTEEAPQVITTATMPSRGSMYSYSPSDAVSYANMYTDSACNGTSGIPPCRNPYFYLSTECCMAFVSQCLWAGFDCTMDYTTPYVWYSGTTANSNSTSWQYIPTFRDYVTGQPTAWGYDQVGIGSDQYIVPNSSDNLGFSAAELKGAPVIVKGSSNELGHTVIIVEATGNTRSSVYFSAYNNQRKHVLLGQNGYYPASLNSIDKLLVIVPRFFYK